jgi:VanZ family protein
MNRFFRNWGPMLAYFLLIFLLSSLPIHVKEGPDKILHALEYGLMGFLAARGVLLTWNISRLWGVVLGASMALACGVFDELHQHFVPGRTASVFDALADLVGGVLGAWLFVYLGTWLYGSRKLYPDAHDKCC